MLALALIRFKSRSKFGVKRGKNQSYQLTKYLLGFCLHKINIFYPAY